MAFLELTIEVDTHKVTSDRFLERIIEKCSG